MCLSFATQIVFFHFHDISVNLMSYDDLSISPLSVDWMIDNFCLRFGLTPDEAGICNSLVYFIGAGASPIAGILIDKYGKNVLWRE